MNIKRLKLRPAGMFSNVNEVVQQLFLAEQSNYEFIIDWSSSCYLDQNREIDPWLYYFKPCFDVGKIDTSSLSTLTGGVPIACTKNNIITPRLYDGVCDPLLLPKDRSLAHSFIKKYIHVNNTVQQEVDNFKQNFFHEHIIGLHIRGAGRTDGGVPKLRKKYKCENGIPFSLYFESVRKILENKPNSKIFACTDSEIVIQTVKKEFGDRVITYNSTRSEFGEMHAKHIENNGESFPNFKLGLDVVVEAYLLSYVDYFVHGNSNIVNFVLCKSPDLQNHYVYEKTIKYSFLKSLKNSIRRLIVRNHPNG